MWGPLLTAVYLHKQFDLFLSFRDKQIHLILVNLDLCLMLFFRTKKVFHLFPEETIKQTFNFARLFLQFPLKTKASPTFLIAFLAKFSQFSVYFRKQFMI